MNKGVILAGGLGTRLRPLTYITNKHLLPVYDKPMIEYPLQTLIDMGCDDILIVTGQEHVGHFAEYLGDGSRYGTKLTYRVQPKAGGIAQALGCAEGFIKDHETFPVILGDNYFEKPILNITKPSIFIKKIVNPNRFGVINKKLDHITEKPENPETDYAVTGLYIYDFKVFAQIRRLVPSERGELEITDINNWYLDNGAEVKEYGHRWSDLGTFDTLMEVASNVQHI